MKSPRTSSLVTITFQLADPDGHGITVYTKSRRGIARLGYDCQRSRARRSCGPRCRARSARGPRTLHDLLEYHAPGGRRSMTAITHVRPMTGIRPSSDARCGKRIEGPTMSMPKWLAVASFVTVRRVYSTYAMADSDGPSPARRTSSSVDGKCDPGDAPSAVCRRWGQCAGAKDGRRSHCTLLTEAVDLWSRFLYRGVLFNDQWTLQPSAASLDVRVHRICLGFSSARWKPAASTTSE